MAAPGYDERMIRIPAESRVFDLAAPVHLSGRPELPAVLLIHGFTGSPYELTFLAHRLNEAGYEVRIPRLAGHGTSREDFLQTGAKDWYRDSLDAYLDLRSSFPRVIVGGLSMGGLLAISLAAAHPVDRLLLYAPALSLQNRWAGMANILWPFLAYLDNKSWKPDPEDPVQLGEMRRVYNALTWVRPVYHLNKLVALARRSLPGLDCPSLLFLSKADRTVRMDTASIIQEGARNAMLEMKILEESGHLITCGKDKEFVAQETLAWLSR